MNKKELKARGQKIKKTIIERYGKNFFREVGELGGNPMLLKIRDEKLKAAKKDLAGPVGDSPAELGGKRDEQLITSYCTK